jgi:hypothetical protein
VLSLSDILLCNNIKENDMHVLTIVLGRVEAFLEAQAVKYRDAYLAQVQDIPESERRSGHRGMFLP